MKKGKEKKPGPIGQLLTYLRPYKVKMIIAIIFIFISALGFALAPMLMGFGIDDLGKIAECGDVSAFSDNLIKNLVLALICFVIYALMMFISNKMIVNATQNAVYDLRKEIDKKISKLPLNYFDKSAHGDILARLTNDVETVSKSLQQSIYEIFNTIFTVIIILAMMIYISGWLTLISIIVLPVLVFVVIRIAGKSEKEFDEQMKQTGVLNGYVEEYYSGQNVITLFGREKESIHTFEETNRKLRNASVKGQFLAGTLFPITKGLSNVSYALVCLGGIALCISGGLTIGMIQAFTQYLLQFMGPLATLMQIMGIIQSTKAASGRVFEFLGGNEEISEVKETVFPKELKGNVVFNHIKFGYTPDKMLIKDLTISVPAGSKIAIVGPTGAGKTTLVNLIMRFYDVNSGTILVDGVDIRDMKRESLRNIFGMVLQDTWLFCGTIRENIRYGCLNATDEEVIAAARAARADGFIRALPGGYDFVLSEDAGNIAQGQRQLLTIARAMLANPPVMILDEATSSVDTRTELLIQEALAEMMKGRTSFVIAHRLSTIKDSDNIFYMQDGDILEVGKHEELMAKNGLYAALYNSQFSDKS